jgi:hypothetical protein
MSSYVINDFIAVNSNFTPKGIFERTTIVWVFLACIIGSIVLCFGVAEVFNKVVSLRKYAADEKAREIIAATGQDLISSLRKQSVAGTLVARSPRAKQTTKAGAFDPKATLQAYVESLFPVVFSSKPTASRFLDELTSNHLLLTAIFDESIGERLISAYEVLSLLLQGCFTVAVVTSLEIGTTNEECSENISEAECLSRTSIRDTDSFACDWHEVSLECTVNAALSDRTLADSLLPLLYVILLTLLVGIPLRVAHQVIFTGILRAKTETSGQEEAATLALENLRSPLVHPTCTAAVASAVSASESEDSGAIPVPFTKPRERVDSIRSGLGRVGFGRDIRVPAHVIALRNKVFSTAANKRNALMRDMSEVSLKLDELSGDVLGKQLHMQLVAYIAHCRERGVSYSTDRHARRAGLRKEVLIKANEAFQRAWKLQLVDPTTMCAVQTYSSSGNEQLSLLWDDWRGMLELLDELLQDARVAADNMDRYSSGAAGAELCRQLVIDLLGRNTAMGKVYESKSSWHLQSTLVVPLFFKVAAFAMSGLLNLYFVWMCVLYGGAKDHQWQMSWLLNSVLFCFFMVTIEMTAEAVFIGFVIPCQVLSDVRALQAEFAERLNEQEVFQALLNHANGYDGGCDGKGKQRPNKSDSSSDTDIENKLHSKNKSQNVDVDPTDPEQFSATDFLFVSKRLAERYKFLPESALVDVFRTAHPRRALQSAGRVKVGAGKMNMDDRPLYARIIGLLGGAAGFGGVLLWLGGQPLVIQKLLVNAPLPMLSSIMGGLMYVTSQGGALFAICSGLVAVGLLLLFISIWTVRGVRRTVENSMESDKTLRKNIEKLNDMDNSNLKNEGKHGPGKKQSLLKVASISPATSVSGLDMHGKPLLLGGGNVLNTTGRRRKSILEPAFDEDSLEKFEMAERETEAFAPIQRALSDLAIDIASPAALVEKSNMASDSESDSVSDAFDSDDEAFNAADDFVRAAEDVLRATATLSAPGVSADADADADVLGTSLVRIADIADTTVSAVVDRNRDSQAVVAKKMVVADLGAALEPLEGEDNLSNVHEQGTVTKLQPSDQEDEDDHEDEDEDEDEDLFDKAMDFIATATLALHQPVVVDHNPEKRTSEHQHQHQQQQEEEEVLHAGENEQYGEKDEEQLAREVTARARGETVVWQSGAQVAEKRQRFHSEDVASSDDDASVHEAPVRIVTAAGDGPHSPERVIHSMDILSSDVARSSRSDKGGDRVIMATEAGNEAGNKAGSESGAEADLRSPRKVLQKMVKKKRKTAFKGKNIGQAKKGKKNQPTKKKKAKKAKRRASDSDVHDHDDHASDSSLSDVEDIINVSLVRGFGRKREI